MQKRRLRDEFKRCQHIFDKRVRFFKRRFTRGQAMHLEQLQSNNPQKFWSEINRLGPKKVQKIPMEVRLPNGDLENRTEKVLKVWESEFANLYSGQCIPPIFDESFLANISHSKDALEREMDEGAYAVNQLLNGNLTLEEVIRAIDKAKNGKAAGIEGLYNEVLKAPKILPVLFSLFQTCFKYSIIPSLWYKSIIEPIPKSAKNDPRVPLNYRGISLMSTVYKLYSSILNSRLS